MKFGKILKDVFNLYSYLLDSYKQFIAVNQPKYTLKVLLSDA